MERREDQQPHFRPFAPGDAQHKPSSLGSRGANLGEAAEERSQGFPAARLSPGSGSSAALRYGVKGALEDDLERLKFELLGYAELGEKLDGVSAVYVSSDRAAAAVPEKIHRGVPASRLSFHSMLADQTIVETAMPSPRFWRGHWWRQHRPASGYYLRRLDLPVPALWALHQAHVATASRARGAPVAKLHSPSTYVGLANRVDRLGGRRALRVLAAAAGACLAAVALGAVAVWLVSASDDAPRVAVSALASHAAEAPAFDDPSAGAKGPARWSRRDGVIHGTGSALSK